MLASQHGVNSVQSYCIRKECLHQWALIEDVVPYVALRLVKTGKAEMSYDLF